MSYNYSSSNKGHSSRSAKNQTYVSYSSKSKEYKLYEPKSSNNCTKDSENESQSKTPLTNRDSFDAERPYHTREKRFEKNRGYKPQEHSNGWQNKNNRCHTRTKDNVRIDYIPVLESRDAGTSKESDIHDTAEADRVDRVDKRNSSQTFESDSNEAENLKSGYKTRIGLSTASSEEQSSGNESCRTSEFMQGQNCDIQCRYRINDPFKFLLAFWEKIKNTDFKEPGSTSGETPKEGKESSSKAENRNLISDKSQTNLNIKSLTHAKAKFEKVLFIEDNENDQINITNQKSSSNNGNVSEETEESDDEKYSDTDIMVEKKLLNNAECETNHDANVFDDFNEGTSKHWSDLVLSFKGKDDVEDLDTSERPVWENSDTTKLLEDINKESYASIPDCLLNSQRPENVEAIGKNTHIQKGGIENAIPPTLCNEQILKSILKIDAEIAKPTTVEKPVMVQDLACAFIPWNNTRMIFNDRSGNYYGPKNICMPLRRDPPILDKPYSNFPQLQTMKNSKEGCPYYNYYHTIQTPFYPINNSGWQTYGVNYGHNVIGAPLNDKNNPFFNTQILDDESFITRNIENLLLDSPKLCQNPSLADLNVFLETIKKNNQSPTSSCEPKKTKQYLSLNLFGEVTWKAIIEEEEEEEETNGNKDPQAASLCLLKW